MSAGGVRLGKPLQHPPSSLLLLPASPDHLRAATRRYAAARRRPLSGGQGPLIWIALQFHPVPRSRTRSEPGCCPKPWLTRPPTRPATIVGLLPCCHPVLSAASQIFRVDHETMMRCAAVRTGGPEAQVGLSTAQPSFRAAQVGSPLTFSATGLSSVT